MRDIHEGSRSADDDRLDQGGVARRTTRHRSLLVPGSTRRGSTNVAALRGVRDATELGVAAVLFEGLPDVPAFNPVGGAE